MEASSFETEEAGVAWRSALRRRSRPSRDDDEEDDEEDDDVGEEDNTDDRSAASPPPLEGDEADAAGDDAGTTAATANEGSTTNSVVEDNRNAITAVPDLNKLAGLRELGPDAVCWQLSSAKPGNGVEQIRDPSLETYWQSDGQTQPHWIQVHFARRVAISHVCLYLDYHLDESYTPKKISVNAGMTHQDLQEAVPEVEVPEPSGWVILPLKSPPDPLDHYDQDLNDDDDNTDNPPFSKPDGDDDLLVLSGSSRHYYNHRIHNHKNVVRAHLIRIIIHAMHQNGRDTHIRQVRLYGPWQTTSPFVMADHHHTGLLLTSPLHMVQGAVPAAATKDKKKKKRNSAADQSWMEDASSWYLGVPAMDSIHASRFTTIR